MEEMNSRRRFFRNAAVAALISSVVAGIKMLFGVDPKRDYKDKVAKVDLRN